MIPPGSVKLGVNPNDVTARRPHMTAPNRVTSRGGPGAFIAGAAGRPAKSMTTAHLPDPGTGAPTRYRNAQIVLAGGMATDRQPTVEPPVSTASLRAALLSRADHVACGGLPSLAFRIAEFDYACARPRAVPSAQNNQL